MDLHTSFITDVILERILIEILEIMPLLCVPIRSLSLLLKGLSYLPRGLGYENHPAELQEWTAILDLNLCLLENSQDRLDTAAAAE